MDKIEKLMHIKTDKNQHVSPDTVFEMCCKINEIIDVLNSWVFEPTLTIPSQSQKQPERWTTPEVTPKGGEEFEYNGEKFKWGKVYASKPEKQEDLRLVLYELCDSTSCYSINGGDYVVRATFKFDELVDFISQLLSESKEKAKIEVLEKVLEKKTNYEIEREEHGYRVTLEYVLADDIKKEIKLLKERK